MTGFCSNISEYILEVKISRIHFHWHFQKVESAQSQVVTNRAYSTVLTKYLNNNSYQLIGTRKQAICWKKMTKNGIDNKWKSLTVISIRHRAKT
jgi:hypothetical protein